MSPHALGATWRALLVRFFVLCFCLASVTQGSALDLHEGGQQGPDSTPHFAAQEVSPALAVGGKTRKQTAEKLSGSDRVAAAVRHNLLPPHEYCAFRTDHDRLVHETALLRVVPLRGPPQHS